MVGDIEDERRVSPAMVGAEHPMLDAWLEWHRMTLLLKCEGLDPSGLAQRPIATSKLSLHGLVRHMADVERNWFTRVLLRAPDTLPIFYDRAIDDDRELAPLDDADWSKDLSTWQAECSRSRDNARRFDLDHLGLLDGEECSLRWIYMHMIEEYSRHNGHADLIREMVDGTVGG